MSTLQFNLRTDMSHLASTSTRCPCALSRLSGRCASARSGFRAAPATRQGRSRQALRPVLATNQSQQSSSAECTTSVPGGSAPLSEARAVSASNGAGAPTPAASAAVSTEAAPAPGAPLAAGQAAGAAAPSGSPAAPSGSQAPGGGEQAAEMAELGALWENIKKDLRKDMRPEEAQVLDAIEVDDLLHSQEDLMRKVAEQQLGPILAQMGVSEEPLAFFVDLLRLATGLQLLSGGAVFYGAELLGGLDSGEAFRCVAGLSVGYLSRPFLKVEQLLWPLYDWALSYVAPGAVYQVAASKEESQATLNRLGVIVAVGFFVPQLAWGWEAGTCLQLVLPMAAGWLLFDVMYCVALLAKLR